MRHPRFASPRLTRTCSLYTAVRRGILRPAGTSRDNKQVRACDGIKKLRPFLFFFSSHIYFPASGQAVVTGVVPSFPRRLPSILIAHRAQPSHTHRAQPSHCSSIFYRVLLKLTLSRFLQVNWCARKSPHECIRDCTRGNSNSRN